MADPAAAKNRNALNQNHKKRGDVCKVAASNRKALNQIHKKRGDVCKVAKCEKKIRQNFFFEIMKKPGTYID